VNGTLKCAKCSATIPDHKWGKIKSEWVFVNKKQYCPKHIPDWYPEWVELKLLRKLEKQLFGYFVS
jgi:hypothetical protein